MSQSEGGSHDVSSTSGFPIHNRNSVTSTGNRFGGSMVINLLQTSPTKAYTQIGQFHRWASDADGIDVGSSCQCFGNVKGISSSSDITRIRVLANHSGGNQTFTTGIIGVSYKASASGGGSGLLNISDSAQGVTVTGDIAVSGTVDGRDVASDGTKLDTIASNATAYGDADVDTHLNQANPTSGYVSVSYTHLTLPTICSV